MLKFNPKQMFLMRGIEKTTNFLVRLGYSYPTASKFLKSKSSFVKLKDIEKMCLALNCTPNDLFEWQPDTNSTVAESHALYALKKEQQMSVRQLVKDLPVEKLSKLHEFIDELKKE